MVSLGDWRYASNYTADVFDDNQNLIVEDQEVFADGQPIGDAAQNTFNIGLNVFPTKGLKLYADYFYADKLFAQFNLTESQFLAEGGEVAQIPSYNLIDAGLSYTFDFANNSKSGLTLYGNVNNLTDNIYIAEMFTNIKDNPATEDVNEIYDNKGFVGFGRTWNVGAKFRF